MQVNQSCCTGCGYCALICPYDAIVSDGWAYVHPDRCTDCNICLAACPNNCLLPVVPPRPRQADWGSDYDVVIVGAGLGGLMAAAALAQTNQRVAVFEQLGFPGGRYTEIRHHGYRVTTGAWTPLGPKSHIGRFLADVGADVRWITLRDKAVEGKTPELFHIYFADGRRYRSFQEMLDPQELRRYLRALARGRRPGADQISIRDHLLEFGASQDLLAAVDANVATASGLHADRVPASEYVQIVRDTQAAGDSFGFPAGGPQTLIRALVQVVRRHGGRVVTQARVARILVESGRTVGVEMANGAQVQARQVIHNGGPRQFLQLVGQENLPTDYVERLQGLERVDCGALIVATREPLFEGTPMLLTPGCQQVVGIFSPTFFDPRVAPPNRHLVDVFFPLESEDRRAELKKVSGDLLRLFPQLDDVLEWCLPMLFTGAWTGTESGQIIGQVGEGRLLPATPIENLYLVGMDVQGSGVAGDVVPLGVRRLLERIGE
ncbi:MAG TPA: FAD-dependent oxidoreductase [Anaerolineae bacterium]|nr:FAD-dependent oxidoreductase [Anaerolineae bacterium]